jgi:para-aminobenzoate synthetase component 1
MPIISLPYHPDSRRIFNTIRDYPFACWLDSGKPNSHSGRYDIMSALPSQRWSYENNSCRISRYQYSTDTKDKMHYTEDHTVSNDDPFDLIKAASEQLIEREKNTIPNVKLPFTGGIISYFSYDMGRQAMDIEQQTPSECQLPNMVAGLYTWAIIQDHELQQCHLASLAECDPNVWRFVSNHLTSIPTEDTADIATEAWAAPLHIDTLQSNTSQAEYYQHVARINDYIHAGDCYQVNYSQCFSAAYQGDTYSAYLRLRDHMASPFSAFMDIGNQQSILSLSPERLIRTHDKQVLTQPIKGTIARDSHALTDANNARALQASSKNRAENLMIVDLLRNDLGKNCIAGSIRVPELFTLESYPNVHHLVSSITGTIADNNSAFDVFTDCFPGGSITGAPKKRAMEIIEELEHCQRTIYCGSIVYINATGDIDSNITIRTIACDGEKMYCWGGGGIVADSQAEEEYQESLTKIQTILATLKEFSSSSR